MPSGKQCCKLKLLCDKMKNTPGFFTLAFVLSVLSGCSYIQSLFPDKERDYQYTTEIPMLNWPSGLRENKADNHTNEFDQSSTKSEASVNSDISTEIETPPASASDNSETPTSTLSGTGNTEITPADESDAKDSLSSIDIVKYDDGESRLRVGASFSKSWRVVNKALTHNAIEVTERNHDQGYIKIQYDPDEQKSKDESFMDEINFIIKGINSNDKAYVLKIEEHEQKTDVIVLNDEHLPLLNDNNALRLLTLLSDAIKADLAGHPK